MQAEVFNHVLVICTIILLLTKGLMAVLILFFRVNSHKLAYAVNIDLSEVVNFLSDDFKSLINTNKRLSLIFLFSIFSLAILRAFWLIRLLWLRDINLCWLKINHRRAWLLLLWYLFR